jgi:hypothetical protein
MQTEVRFVSFDGPMIVVDRAYNPRKAGLLGSQVHSATARKQ